MCLSPRGRAREREKNRVCRVTGISRRIMRASALSRALPVSSSRKSGKLNPARCTLPFRNSFSPAPSSFSPLSLSLSCRIPPTASKRDYPSSSTTHAHTHVRTCAHTRIIYAKLSNPEMTSYTRYPPTSSSRKQEGTKCAREASGMTERHSRRCGKNMFPH